MPLLNPRETPPFKVHRRLFGWAVGHKPQTLYERLNKPIGLAEAVDEYAVDSPDSPLRKIAKTPDGIYIFQARDALRQSIDDILRIVSLGLATNNKIWQASIQNKDSSFLAAIGSVAMLPQEEIATYFHVQNKRLADKTLTSLDLREDAHTATDTEVDITRGCPFAKSQAIRIDPLFTKFVTWSTELALEAQQATTTDIGQVSTQ